METDKEALHPSWQKLMELASETPLTKSVLT